MQNGRVWETGDGCLWAIMEQLPDREPRFELLAPRSRPLSAEGTRLWDLLPLGIHSDLFGKE